MQESGKKNITRQQLQPFLRLPDIEPWKKQIYQQEGACRKEMWMALFGFDIDEEKQSLTERITAANLEHKDLTDRNLLVSWDVKTGLPKKPKKNEPPLMVVDWEER